MRAEEVLEGLRRALGERLRSPRMVTEEVGHRVRRERGYIWAEIGRDDLLRTVEALKELGPLHISIISGTDVEDRIELIYHFAVGYGTEGGEVMVNLRISVPKSDPVVPSICSLLPGAETTEREKIEFLGVKFQGIPDSRHLFLPDDMGVHPWRKDEPDLKKYVRYTVEWEAQDGGEDKA
ncbi:MAG TPA: NADH-quinone oxidoreductase subunit C [Candidatus Acetothermia bacterium]|nr:NADH-quinone oxidoreductase subunit C [Candidatus Acetothermia bacterium]